MIVIVDERELVKEGYHSLFDREGVASAGFGSSEFGEWVTSAADEDVNSVRAFLIGDCGEGSMLAAQDPRPHRRTGHRAQRAAFAGEHAAAVRVRRRRRRAQAGPHPRDPGPHLGDPPPRQEDRQLHRDRRHAHLPGRPRSRDRRPAAAAAAPRAPHPRISGEPTRGRRVTKTQVFNAIYGIFDDEVEENVVESHISKLRKKLRDKLGYDPIDSKRFLGYRLIV